MRGPALVLTLSLASLAGCVGLSGEDTFRRSGANSGGAEGTICLPGGIEGVRGARVEVYADDDMDEVPDSDTVIASTFTDIDGNFVFEDLTAGSYVATANRGHFDLSFAFTFVAGNRATVAPSCFEVDEVAITQIDGSCDDPKSGYEDMGFEVTTLGTSDQEWLDLLTNANDVDDVEILLLPCGLPEDWLPQGPTISTVLYDWMDAGGSLYVSGDAWPVIEAIDADALDMLRDDLDLDAPEVGFGEVITARIVDQELTPHFPNGTARIRMTDGWPVVSAVGEGMSVIVDGPAATIDFENVDNAPLMAQRTLVEGGGFIYSTFGWTAESNDDMELILREKLLSL